MSSKKISIEKVKELLETVSGVDIMYHDERKKYFFEWMKDGKFITIWLEDELANKNQQTDNTQHIKESASDAFDRGFTAGYNAGVKMGLASDKHSY